MKVSIITVTYNSAKHLDQCIKSVINQDYPNIEYLVIDGKSSDNTLKIIEENKKHINFFISEPDKGIYDAINKGILHATGDIIGILNSDDYFSSPDIVSDIAYVLSKKNYEICFANVHFVNENLNIIRKYNSKYFNPWMFRFGFQPAHPSFYTFKNNFTRYGYYNFNFKIAGDFELMLRFLYIHKLSYTFLDKTLVNMRLGGVSTSNFKNKLKLNNEILYALRLHNIYSNYFLIYSKYLFKWVGYIFN